MFNTNFSWVTLKNLYHIGYNQDSKKMFLIKLAFFSPSKLTNYHACWSLIVNVFSKNSGKVCHFQQTVHKFLINAVASIEELKKEFSSNTVIDISWDLFQFSMRTDVISYHTVAGVHVIFTIAKGWIIHSRVKSMSLKNTGFSPRRESLFQNRCEFGREFCNQSYWHMVLYYPI